MLLTLTVAQGIRDGSVTAVFRRWDAPRVRVGGTQRTGVGVIRFTSLDRVDEASLTLRAALPGSDEIAGIATELDRMDRGRRTGPWTRTILRLIEANPAVRAPDLAASLGRETKAFKLDVRKLKELGLTHSLDVGYELSPRGRALLDAQG